MSTNLVLVNLTLGVSRQTGHMTGTSAHAPQDLRARILSWAQLALALMGCRATELVKLYFEERRSIGRFEVGHSQVEVSEWLQVDRKLSPDYGINSKQGVWSPRRSAKVGTEHRDL
ncbi:hypothetical protein TNCV_1472391 [Trichonephila clavipes]|nr:hypothetical protein TNCV_1472391 [Trichonephila clavipes]